MKRRILGFALAVLLAAALVVPAAAQSPSFSDHIIISGTAPALTSCGTTPAIVGSDIAGKVTMGTTATGCVITFARAYPVAPACVVTWAATPLASQSYVVATTAITLTQTSASNNIVYYFCAGTAN